MLAALLSIENDQPNPLSHPKSYRRRWEAKQRQAATDAARSAPATINDRSRTIRRGNRTACCLPAGDPVRGHAAGAGAGSGGRGEVRD